MLLHADARQLPIADASVHCVVTSPPYWGLRDYGHAGQLGLEPTPEAYVTNLVAVFREVWRVLKADGTVWINLGDSFATFGGPVTKEWKHIMGQGTAMAQSSRYADTSRGQARYNGLKPKDLVGIPWRVAFALQADGWYLRSDIIWHKPNPMPESVTDRPTKAHEYVFLLTKAERYYYDAAAIAEPFSELTEWRRPRIDVGRMSAGVSNGASDSTGLRRDPGGTTRNKRTVWTIPTLHRRLPRRVSGAPRRRRQRRHSEASGAPFAPRTRTAHDADRGRLTPCRPAPRSAVTSSPAPTSRWNSSACAVPCCCSPTASGSTGSAATTRRASSPCSRPRHTETSHEPPTHRRADPPRGDPRRLGDLVEPTMSAPKDPQPHAPRGPLVRKDPMERPHPMERPRCTATNRRGTRCEKSPEPGATVCRMHGGAAPQVKQAAMERLRALQHPAIDRLTKLIDQEEFPTVAYAASRDVLDRTMGKAPEHLDVTVTATAETLAAFLEAGRQRNAERTDE